MKVNGDIEIFLAAIVLWAVAVRIAGEAITAYAAGEYLTAALCAFCAPGAVSLGFKVWGRA